MKRYAFYYELTLGGAGHGNLRTVHCSVTGNSFTLFRGNGKGKRPVLIVGRVDSEMSDEAAELALNTIDLETLGIYREEAT